MVLDLIEFVGEAILGALEGLAGILRTNKIPEVHSLQWICRLILSIGFAFFIAAIAMFYRTRVLHVLTLLGIASLLFIVSGYLGRRISRICDKDLKSLSNHRSPNHATSRDES